jgi:hypothetical protein
LGLSPVVAPDSIPAMSKLTLVSALLAGCLVGCGSPPPPTSPAEDPGLPEPEVVEPEPIAQEPIDPDQEEMEISEPESTEPEATEPPPPVEEPPPMPTCAELKRGRCKVTQGCAWREGAVKGKGECIEQGVE